MARDFLPFIRNHYELITTAPPSARRCPVRYCVHDLANAISRMAKIPFAPAFSRKTDKAYHGRHSSLSQSEPTLLPSWNVCNRSILFVDDCITSGTTARLCYEALDTPFPTPHDCAAYGSDCCRYFHIHDFNREIIKISISKHSIKSNSLS